MTRPTILYVCVHNAGRSQVAAALTGMLAGDRVDVRSAGSEPAAAVHPNVVAVMAEIGIDLSSRQPKLLADDAVRDADAVITMGCGDACPVFPGKRYLDWQIDDPAGATLGETRRIRGLIRLRVESLLRDLGEI
jgi:arsenate reductase